MFELLNQQLRAGRKEITGEFFQKLIASDGTANNYFGTSVSVSSDGSVVVVGANNDDDKGNSSGSAYVFIKQANGNYLQTQKLTASDGAGGDYFGRSTSVSADGTVIVVGAYLDDDKGSSSGSAYVFTKQANGDYLQTQKLTASDGAADDSFSYSVSTSADGSVVVVGAYADDDKSTNSGSVYVFTKQANGSYLQTQKLTASDGAAHDYFGRCITITPDESVVVIGAYSKNGGRGAVYIFKRQVNGSYLETQKLTATDTSAGDYFGYSVSVSSDSSTVVVGAYGDDDKGAESGSAYVFTRQANGSYAQFQKLAASDGATSDSFGYSVSVSSDGSVVVVGAYSDNDKGADSGSVYVFTKQTSDTYTQKQKLTPPTTVQYALFGCCVSVSDEAVVVGAYSETVNGKSATGAAYIFK